MSRPRQRKARSKRLPSVKVVPLHPQDCLCAFCTPEHPWSSDFKITAAVLSVSFAIIMLCFFVSGTIVDEKNELAEMSAKECGLVRGIKDAYCFEDGHTYFIPRYWLNF